MTRTLTRFATLVVLTIGVLCTTSAHAAVSNQRALFSAAADFTPTPLRMLAPPMDETWWIDEVMDLLKRLYILLGGDPKNLDQSGTAAGCMASMATVQSYYALRGVPSGMSSSDKAAAHDAITEMLDYLTAPPDDIKPGTFGTTLTSIDAVMGY